MMAVGVLMTVVLAALSFSTDEYAKGVIRTAVDEAAQAGATAGGSATVCKQEGELVMQNLLRGTLGSQVSIRCSVMGPEMMAAAQGGLVTLLPGGPHLNVRIVGMAPLPVRPVQ